MAELIELAFDYILSDPIGSGKRNREENWLPHLLVGAGELAVGVLHNLRGLLPGCMSGKGKSKKKKR